MNVCLKFGWKALTRQNPTFSLRLATNKIIAWHVCLIRLILIFPFGLPYWQKYEMQTGKLLKAQWFDSLVKKFDKGIWDLVFLIIITTNDSLTIFLHIRYWLLIFFVVLFFYCEVHVFPVLTWLFLACWSCPPLSFACNVALRVRRFTAHLDCGMSVNSTFWPCDAK